MDSRSWPGSVVSWRTVMQWGLVVQKEPMQDKAISVPGEEMGGRRGGLHDKTQKARLFLS